MPKKQPIHPLACEGCGGTEWSLSMPTTVLVTYDVTMNRVTRVTVVDDEPTRLEGECARCFRTAPKAVIKAADETERGWPAWEVGT